MYWNSCPWGNFRIPLLHAVINSRRPFLLRRACSSFCDMCATIDAHYCHPSPPRSRVATRGAFFATRPLRRLYGRPASSSLPRPSLPPPHLQWPRCGLYSGGPLDQSVHGPGRVVWDRYFCRRFSWELVRSVVLNVSAFFLWCRAKMTRQSLVAMTFSMSPHTYRLDMALATLQACLYPLPQSHCSPNAALYPRQ